MTKYEMQFWSKVEKRGPDECWLWQAFCMPSFGHGQFSWRRDKRGFKEHAHRVAWRLTFGEIPAGLCVLHRCDVPRCCNPAHLWLGTRADNLADMRAKGRQAVGRMKPNARLSDDVVRWARARVEDGHQQKAIARFLGISSGILCQVVNRKRWKHVA